MLLDSSLFVLSILLEDVCNMEMKNKKINENIYFSFYNSLSFLGFFLHVNLLFLAILLIIKVKHFVVERFFLSRPTYMKTALCSTSCASQT